MHSKLPSIGQGRQYPDPQDAMEAHHGMYRDSVEGMTPQQKYANLAMPSGPDPSPFANLSNPVGPGRGGQ